MTANGRSEDYQQIGEQMEEKKKKKISSSASPGTGKGKKRARVRIHFIIFQQIFCRVQQTSTDCFTTTKISAVAPSLCVNVTNVLLSYHVPCMCVFVQSQRQYAEKCVENVRRSAK